MRLLKRRDSRDENRKGVVVYGEEVGGSQAGEKNKEKRKQQHEQDGK